MADRTFNDIHVDMDTTVMFRERKRLLFFGLPWTFTKYTITPSLLTISQGLLNTTEDDCYMYKIQDVRLTTSLLERLFGLSTVICYTGDVTHHEIRLVHIRNASEIKTYLLKTSEEARIKRRTLSTIDISAGSGDIEDISDAF
ncbi:MAG: PH domain-containing protein [Agathobacter sp.]